MRPDIAIKLQPVVESVMTEISGLQNAYFASHGRYFQGIKTTDIVPKEGTLVTPDKTRKPHHQLEDWNDFGANINDLPFSLEICSYQSPFGCGWESIFLVEIDGVKHAKIVGEGVESYFRNFDWRAYGDIKQ